MIKKLN